MSTKPFKPMLAASIDTDAGESVTQLKYPVLATPKKDGIRCIVKDGQATSRSLKPIANRFVQSILGSRDFNGLDGELFIPGTFQDVTSGIMSSDGEPNFSFCVFDAVPEFVGAAANTPYSTRMKWLADAKEDLVTPHRSRFEFLLPELICTPQGLETYLEKCLAAGEEGAMVRSPEGIYKYGRSTFKEGLLVKVKPLADAEATITGFEEQMKNGNEATTNALGRTERSSHKANLIPKGTLGALVVNSPKFGEFRIGTGLDDALRAQIWANRQQFLGKVVTFRYQVIGTKDKPRIPSFKGFRDPRDL